MEILPLAKAVRVLPRMREFNQPELTGPSGEPIEVPDSLAARILGFALEDRDSFELMEDSDPQLIASVLAHAKALAGEKKDRSTCTPFGPSLPAKVSSATPVFVMKLDQKEGFTSFDDGPEMTKLQGWYDRLREDASYEGRPGPLPFDNVSAEQKLDPADRIRHPQSARLPG